MTHRTVVDLQTGVTSIVEYTAEEQAIHDAAVAAQAEALADAAPEPTLLEIIAELQAKVTALESK